MLPIAAGAELELLFTGTSWGEGPVWVDAQSCLRWSDIPADRIMQFDARTGDVSVYRSGAGGTNGQTIDRAGRVIGCLHGGRRVDIEIDGRPQPLVESWASGRFNSPNDVVVARDGSVWFTDPPYGLLARDGSPVGEADYDGCYVFRFDPADGSVTAVVTDMEHPNGLAFSVDERTIYISDSSRAVSPAGNHHIVAYDVENGGCVRGRVFADIEPGLPDGIRVDREGRLWVSSEGAVQVFDTTDGTRLGTIAVPGIVTNLCFDRAGALYITTAESLYRIRTTTTGADAAD